MAKETIKDAKSAESVETKVEAVQEQAPKKERKTMPESVYSFSELASNAGNLFGTMPECVMAALIAAGKTECTVSETKEIVTKFLNREEV